MKKPERKFKRRRLKEYRNLLMSNRVWDWDFSSVLELEKLQLSRIARAIAKDTWKHEGWRQDVWWIKLTIKLLDMILNDTWWDLDEKGKMVLKSHVNTRNATRFIPKFNEIPEDGVRNNFLYEEKLWHLYCKIRQNKLRGWWS